MFLKWLKIPHSKNFTAQKLKFLDVTKGICVKPGSALISCASPSALIAGGATGLPTHSTQLLAAETVARPGMTL